MPGGPYTVAQAAQLLGVSTKTIRRWCVRDACGRAELLSERTPGGHRRITAAAIDERAARRLLQSREPVEDEEDA